MNNLILIVLALASIGLMSCELSDLNREIQSSKETAFRSGNNLSNDNNFMFHRLDNGLLLYSRSDSTFKLIRFLSPAEQNFSVVDSTSNFSVNQSFTIYTDMGSYSYTVASNTSKIEVAGIGYYYGQEVQNNLLRDDGISWSSEVLTWNIIGGGDDPDYIDCECFKIGAEHDCDHGGEGSSGCSAHDGGTVGPLSWDNSCSVDCNDGYYACCIREGTF